jgi:predicted Zn-dependent peptidase
MLVCVIKYLHNLGKIHLLEHLNFKGTPTFNKRNGNAIFNVLQGMGAQMNATTWNDRTNYYETIPSDKIETVIHIESDRMLNSLLLKEDKDAEMTVVRNEFERGENSPTSVLNKEIWANAYMAHPYHQSTIGWRSDIENMPIEVLRKFYNTYYWPDNASLTIIGDFQKKELFNLVDKYFGKITKAPHDIPQPYTEEPEQLGPRKIVVKEPGQQGVVTIGYKIPGRLHKDLPALNILGKLLGSGQSSLINKTFINSGIAYYGGAGASNFKEVGLFTITLGFAPDKNHEDLNKQLLGMVESVKANGVSQDDVDRIVAKLSAQTILYRDGSGNIASELNEAIAGGDWTDFITGIDRLGAVTATAKFDNTSNTNALTKVVSIPQKPNAEMYIGQYTGIHRMDKEFMPFYIGTSILGGGFSGRLMQTVRDNDGLTYSISAFQDGHSNAGGYWAVNASFNPSLFQKGLDATMVQVNKWYNDGITEEELSTRKANITGSFKVGLSTTGALAGRLLSFLERGLEPSFIDQYPRDVDAVTVEQVNDAISKYIDIN